MLTTPARVPRFKKDAPEELKTVTLKVAGVLFS